jgi:hypothetical protein
MKNNNIVPEIHLKFDSRKKNGLEACGLVKVLELWLYQKILSEGMDN